MGWILKHAQEKEVAINCVCVVRMSCLRCLHNDSVSCPYTVYPKKYAHGCVVLCFVVVMQSFIMNSHEVFIHIHQGCFAGTGAIVRLPQCQWNKPDGYGKISQMCNHNKAQQSSNRVHISWDILYHRVNPSFLNWYSWKGMGIGYRKFMQNITLSRFSCT